MTYEDLLERGWTVWVAMRRPDGAIIRISKDAVPAALERGWVQVGLWRSAA